MKKATILTVVILVAAVGSYVVMAQQNESGSMGGMMQNRGAMMGEQKMMGPCPMCMSMTQSMMQRSMVATEDGGVIIMAGNKLCKYDKNLKMVKQEEINIDMQQMQAKMQDMMKSCPMCQNMMQQQNMMGKSKN